MHRLEEKTEKRARTDYVRCCQVYAVCQSEIAETQDSVIKTLGVKGGTLRGWRHADANVYKEIREVAQNVMEKCSPSIDESLSDAEKQEILEEAFLSEFRRADNSNIVMEIKPRSPHAMRLWTLLRIASGDSPTDTFENLGANVSVLEDWKRESNYDLYKSEANKLWNQYGEANRVYFCPRHTKLDRLKYLLNNYLSRHDVIYEQPRTVDWDREKIIEEPFSKLYVGLQAFYLGRKEILNSLGIDNNTQVLSLDVGDKYELYEAHGQAIWNIFYMTVDRTEEEQYRDKFLGVIIAQYIRMGKAKDLLAGYEGHKTEMQDTRSSNPNTTASSSATGIASGNNPQDSRKVTEGEVYESEDTSKGATSIDSINEPNEQEDDPVSGDSVTQT